MGRDRGEINFRLDKELQPDEWLELLRDFGQNGWQYRNAKTSRISITPLGDDVIDWDGVKSSDANLGKLISRKLVMDEPFGITLQQAEKDDQTSTDRVDLFQKERVLSVWLSDSASDISGYLMVDYSHYLQIFVPLIYKFRNPFEVSITAYVDRI